MIRFWWEWRAQLDDSGYPESKNVWNTGSYYISAIAISTEIVLAGAPGYSKLQWGAKSGKVIIRVKLPLWAVSLTQSPHKKSSQTILCSINLSQSSCKPILGIHSPAAYQIGWQRRQPFQFPPCKGCGTSNVTDGLVRDGFRVSSWWAEFGDGMMLEGPRPYLSGTCSIFWNLVATATCCKQSWFKWI